MADFPYDKQVVLPQQIIDIVNTSCLRILYWYKPVINFTCCNGAKDIVKCTVRSRLWMLAHFPLKIRLHCLVSKCSALPLECYRDYVRCSFVCTALHISRSLFLLIS